MKPRQGMSDTRMTPTNRSKTDRETHPFPLSSTTSLQLPANKKAFKICVCLFCVSARLLGSYLHEGFAYDTQLRYFPSLLRRSMETPEKQRGNSLIAFGIMKFTYSRLFSWVALCFECELVSF